MGYFTYSGLAKIDTLIGGLGSPTGIDIYGDRLIITDNATDEIIIYDIANNYKEVGRIKLKYVLNPDPIGIKVGPDGKIYFVDKINKRANLIENSSVFPVGINLQVVSNNSFKIFPNPASTQINIELKIETQDAVINIVNFFGEIRLSQPIGNSLAGSVNISSLSNGFYFIQVQNGNKVYTQKFIKQ